VKAFLRIITELNIWVAFSVTSLTAISFRDLNRSTHLEYLILLFFGTIAMYNFQRLIRMHVMVQEVYHLRARWYKKLYKWNLFSLVFCFLPLLYLSWRIDLLDYWALGIAAIISLLYPLPVYKFNGKWLRLRDIPFLKIAMVSLVWSIVTFIIPRQLNLDHFSTTSLIQFIERFVFIFAITIPFDIRDVRYDKQATLPKILGVKKAKDLSLLLWSVFLVLFLWNHSLSEQTIAYSFVIIPVFIYGLFLLKNASPKRDPLYYSFWIESIPILQFLLYLFIA